MKDELNYFENILENKYEHMEQLEKEIYKTHNEINDLEEKINNLKYNIKKDNEEFEEKVESIKNKMPWQIYYKDLYNYQIFHLNILEYDLYNLSIEDLNDILCNRIVRTSDGEWTVFIALDRFNLMKKRDEIRFRI
jgi:predicted RNase H-like nuclease (RuvC/YqgF family)